MTYDQLVAGIRERMRGYGILRNVGGVDDSQATTCAHLVAMRAAKFVPDGIKGKGRVAKAALSVVDRWAAGEVLAVQAGVTYRMVPVTVHGKPVTEVLG